jgi:hypothetical protein
MPPCDFDSIGGSDTPFFFQNFLTRTVTANFTGAQVNALAVAGDGASSTFPIAVKVAEIDLQSNAGVIAVSLSSAITNYTAASVCDIYFGLDNGPVSDVNGMSRLFLNHICGQNAIAGLAGSSSRTNSLQMGQNSSYRVNSGQKLAVYMSAPNDAATLLTAAASVYWIGVG